MKSNISCMHFQLKSVLSLIPILILGRRVWIMPWILSSSIIASIHQSPASSAAPITPLAAGAHKNISPFPLTLINNQSAINLAIISNTTFIICALLFQQDNEQFTAASRPMALSQLSFFLYFLPWLSLTVITGYMIHNEAFLHALSLPLHAWLF